MRRTLEIHAFVDEAQTFSIHEEADKKRSTPRMTWDGPSYIITNARIRFEYRMNGKWRDDTVPLEKLLELYLAEQEQTDRIEL